MTRNRRSIGIRVTIGVRRTMIVMRVENWHAVVIDGDSEATKYGLAIIEVGIGIREIGGVWGNIVIVGIVILGILVRSSETAYRNTEKHMGG